MATKVEAAETPDGKLSPAEEADMVAARAEHSGWLAQTEAQFAAMEKETVYISPDSDCARRATDGMVAAWINGVRINVPVGSRYEVPSAFANLLRESGCAQPKESDGNG